MPNSCLGYVLYVHVQLGTPGLVLFDAVYQSPPRDFYKIISSQTLIVSLRFSIKALYPDPAIAY